MRIAVTGADGLLGAELCRQLGDAAIPLRRPACELTDSERLTRMLQRLRPDVVINAAAYTNVNLAEREPQACRASNVQGVINLAEACGPLGCTLVQISSDYVFDGQPGRRPFRETDMPAPRGVYAQSKFDAEQIATEYRQNLIIRTCGLYGQPADKTQRPRFVGQILERAQSGEPLRVVGDQRCTPSYVPHVARAILFLVRAQRRGKYHVVNSGSATWYEFAEAILRQAGSDSFIERITTAQLGAVAPRPRFSVLDCAKYAALRGPALPHWREGLAEHLSAIDASAVHA
ncbi:MAG: dTDP-4-dehydrorhamnose reductase [Pirellulales bacterium]